MNVVVYWRNRSLFSERFDRTREAFRRRSSHALSRTSAVFDDPSLVSSPGFLPMLALAGQVGLREFADAHISVERQRSERGGRFAGRRDGGRRR